MENGNQVYSVGDREYEIHGGDLFIAYPNEIHSTGGYPEEREDMYWIGLNLNSDQRPFMGFPRETEMIRNRLKRLPRVLKSQVSLGRYFERILAMATQYHAGWHLKLEVYVADLLFTVLDIADGSNAERDVSPEIAAALEYIDTNIEERITIPMICEFIGLSRCYFQIKFREEVGCSPGAHILREKIKRAQELLLVSRLTITDIAYELAFSSSQHFSTSFKSFTGMTPSEYARACRNS